MQMQCVVTHELYLAAAFPRCKHVVTKLAKVSAFLASFSKASISCCSASSQRAMRILHTALPFNNRLYRQQQQQVIQQQQQQQKVVQLCMFASRDQVIASANTPMPGSDVRDAWDPLPAKMRQQKVTYESAYHMSPRKKRCRQLLRSSL